MYEDKLLFRDYMCLIIFLRFCYILSFQMTNVAEVENFQQNTMYENAKIHQAQFNKY